MNGLNGPASPSSTDSTGSIAETTLPTPDLLGLSPRSTIASPTVPNDSINGYGPPVKKLDLFSPVSSTRPTSTLPDNGLELPFSPASVPSIAVQDTTFDGYQHTKRTSVFPSSSSRAGPPPPLALRSTMTLPPTPSSPSAGLFAPGMARNGSGLAISGVMDRQSSIETEAADRLPEMTPSPMRANFRTVDMNGNPVSPAPWQLSAQASPAWQGFDHAMPSPGRADWPRRSSQPIFPPPSPLSPANRGRFDPTPNHGLHARNLSLFFPQPGKALVVPEDQELPPESLGSSSEQPGDSLIPEANGSHGRSRFGGNSNWSFGQSTGPQDFLGSPDVKQSKRRGHHHKHSLSHNFFSFLDPTQTNPALGQMSDSSTSDQLASPSPAAPHPITDRPQPVPMPLLHASASTANGLSPLPPTKRDPHMQFLASFALLEALIGAAIWVEGQMSGWRCLAGVGYLVLFDSLGVAVSLFKGEGQGWSSLRKPYGTGRLLALLYFAQSLFLGYAAVCIAKEAIEQVLLGAGAHDHGLGGGHGHGEMGGHHEERGFPHLLLACATLAATFSGAVLGNHASLVDAVGPLFLPARYVKLGVVQKSRRVMANPFSLTVILSSASILLGSWTVPDSALQSLDSALSLILTILVCALTYPSTLAFGHVLLQTAPSPSSQQMISLQKSVRDMEGDRRVLGMGTTRCWAISTGLSFTEQNLSPSRPGSISAAPSRRASWASSINSPQLSPSPTSEKQRFNFGRHEEGVPVVVTVTVHVADDLGDRDVLEVTKDAWNRVSAAVGADSEVTVCVRRGWEGVDEH